MEHLNRQTSMTSSLNEEKEQQTLRSKVRREPQFNLQMEMNKQVKLKRKELAILKEELSKLK